MRYDAVIFDLDGTLTESEPGIIRCVQYAVEKMGFEPLCEDTLRRFIGPPLLDSFERYCGMNASQAEQAVEWYRERFEPIGWKENSVYPGIAPLLRGLKRAGAYVALATSKPVAFSERIAEYFGLSAYLDRIVAAPMQETRHSGKRELIAQALPERFERACMVGDRCFDMEGARANGIDGVGVAYGYGSREELSQAGAAHVVDTVEQLTGLLLEGEESPRGLFISFEGGDGCGKSTQIRRLNEWLTQRGWVVRLSREPGGCPISERIRDVLLDVASEGMSPQCEALLYAAARAQHVREVIRPTLERGEIMLCDRFLDSSLVYQGEGRALGMELVARINEPAVNGLMPDLTLLYDLDAHVGMSRRAQDSALDRIEREKEAFFQTVRSGFCRLSEMYPERIRVIDAAQTVEEVEQDTRRLVQQLLA